LPSISDNEKSLILLEPGVSEQQQQQQQQLQQQQQQQQQQLQQQQQQQLLLQQQLPRASWNPTFGSVKSSVSSKQQRLLFQKSSSTKSSPTTSSATLKNRLIDRRLSHRLMFNRSIDSEIRSWKKLARLVNPYVKLIMSIPWCIDI
jgi:hypothetical protein